MQKEWLYIFSSDSNTVCAYNNYSALSRLPRRPSIDYNSQHLQENGEQGLPSATTILFSPYKSNQTWLLSLKLLGNLAFFSAYIFPFYVLTSIPTILNNVFRDAYVVVMKLPVSDCDHTSESREGDLHCAGQ